MRTGKFNAEISFTAQLWTEFFRYTKLFILTACQRSCGKVLFSVVSVRHSVQGEQGGSYATVTHDALDSTVPLSQPVLTSGVWLCTVGERAVRILV